MLKEIAKCAAIGVAVGAGVMGGMYVGGKLCGAGFKLSDSLKEKFGKDKLPETPAVAK